MPRRELKYGIPVTDENGNRLGESASAAKQAIFQVVVSRIGMAVPAMGEDRSIRRIQRSLGFCIKVDPTPRRRASAQGRRQFNAGEQIGLEAEISQMTGGSVQRGSTPCRAALFGLCG